MRKDEIARRSYKKLYDGGLQRFGVEEIANELASYRTRPGEFANKILGSKWWSAQEEVARALVRQRRVAVRSGHGVGKTYLAADLALWFLYTHRPAVVLTTGPTLKQVQSQLWHEIRKRYANSRKKLPGKMLKSRLELGMESFAMGITASSGSCFQGFHSPNLLIIIDEANGLADQIWEAADACAVGGNNKILAIGNPLRASGRFYRIFRGNSGWHRTRISCLDHPNVLGKGPRIPGAVTEEWIDRKVAEWCEEERSDVVMESCGDGPSTPALQPSNTPDLFLWKTRRYRPNDLFRGRVVGDFPRREDRSLIALSWIEAAQTRQLPAEGHRRAAADVAWFGDDCTVIGMRAGHVMLDMQEHKGIDTMEVAGLIRQMIYAHHPEVIAIDAIGVGAGVVDRLAEDGIEGIDPVNVSKPAYDPDRYANRRAELYWGLRERFRTGEIAIVPDEKLAEELATIRYKINSRGQIQIEYKDEVKSRLNRSPDRADMLALLYDGAGDALANWNPAKLPPSAASILREEMKHW